MSYKMKSFLGELLVASVIAGFVGYKFHLPAWVIVVSLLICTIPLWLATDDKPYPM